MGTHADGLGCVLELCRFWAWRAGLQSTHTMESSFRAYIQCMCLQRESFALSQEIRQRYKAKIRFLHVFLHVCCARQKEISLHTCMQSTHTIKALCIHACSAKLPDAGQVLGGGACDVAAILAGRGCRFNVCICRCVCLLCSHSSSRARRAGRGRGR
jgi:hypothetical protein